MLKPIPFYLRYIAFLSVSTLAVLLVCEGALRLFFHLPRGMFYYRPVDNASLYLPNTTMHLLWTPIPYSIKTNSLGFRGPEITKEKPPGVFRIVALGDSITDGFYVENENTYPYQMEQLLRQSGHKAEVINAARGWSSIDLEFEILQRFCMPLNPDMVVLTFVSNDIEEIRGKSREVLLHSEGFRPEPMETSEWLMFGRTALGELLLDGSLRWRFDKYRHNRDALTDEDRMRRYAIPGGDRFVENAQNYLVRLSKKFDGIAYYQEYNAAQLEIIGNYIYCLGEVNRFCTEHRMRLVFAYYPDYSEIYLTDRRFPLHDYLEKACAEYAIPFVNLTDAFRAKKGVVLHFAPLDFHPNPAGNRLIAETIAGFLEQNALLPGL